jgi:rSAM/selenodomain-associated transferase 1
VDKSVDEVDKPSSTVGKRNILGVFAKQPLPGQVKTRCCPPLTAEAAARLYQVLLSETVARLQGGQNFEVALCYAGEREWFAETFPGIRLVAQQGGDLGERMARALAGFLDEGCDSAALVGSDAPDLPLAYVEQAFIALQSCDLVLGPACDGGYYLIGEAVHRSELFQAIPWSSAAVLAATLERAEQLRLRVTQLAEWEDLDDFAALRRFLQRAPQGPTADFLRAELSAYF